MIKELFIKESIKLVFSIGGNLIKKNKFTPDSSEKEIEKSINNHIRYVKNWSSEINFNELKKSKNLLNSYIELDIFIYPRRIRIDTEEKANIIPIKEIFNYEENHVVILGQPGSGKTTSMKFFCQSVFYNEQFYPEQFNIPFLIRLRDFNKPIRNKFQAGIITEYLFNVLGLKIKTDDTTSVESIIRLKENLVFELLEKLRAIVIIDGFDEIVYKKHKKTITNEISKYASLLEKSRLVITSRTSDFNYNFENISQYELCPLSKAQILDFAKKWLKNPNIAKRFVKEIGNSPFADTTIRPLTLAHLCAIYERIGKIPDKPKTIYQKIIFLLLDEWDEQRDIKRISNYGKFERDRKFDFLANLAYRLTVSTRKSVFSKSQLENVYKHIYQDYDLKLKESKLVVQELESHTGLFIQSGYDFFEFAHKSIQEYLSAEYFVKLPFIPNDKSILERIPNELAIAITISSNPSLYFSELANNYLLKNNLPQSFYQTFLNRLLLEKPSFNRNDDIGITSLKLYSAYLSGFETSQMSLFLNDGMINEFERFFLEIFKRNTFLNIVKQYKVSSIEISTDSTVILRLNLIDIDKHINKKIPYTLFCRESIVKTTIPNNVYKQWRGL